MKISVMIATIALMLACAMTGSHQQPRSFDIQSKSEGRLLSDTCPTRDFQIELRVRLKEPGSILDTVGIDAAPAGAWSLHLTPDRQISFNLWDGRAWSAVVASAKVMPDTDAYITVKRIGDALTLRVQASWSRRPMPTPLSGKPIYVGDYPPDAHWGSSYNIHQAALGQVEVLSIGPPRVMPSGYSDFGARIIDPSGLVSVGDKQLVAAALQVLKQVKGLDAAAVFYSGDDAAKAQYDVAGATHHLIAQGVLPETYAAFVCLQSGRRIFHRSNDVDKVISWDEINPVWVRQAGQYAPAPALARALLELCGAPLPAGAPKPVGPGTVDPVKPIDPGKPADPIKPGPAGSTAVGPAGAAVAAGGARIEIPAGALAQPNELIVRPSVPTPFGEPGLSVEFKNGDPVLLKPARIEFPIPAGADPRRLVAFRSINERAWVSMPLEVDAGRGVAIATTNHFCDSVLLDSSRLKVKISGAVGTLVSGTLLLFFLGAAPVTSTASAATAAVFLLSGWLAGGAAYNKAQSEGLEGPYVTPGFEIYWDPKTVPPGPYLAALIDKRNGNLITWRDSRRQPDTPTIGPATSAPVTTLAYKDSQGRIREVDISDVTERIVPMSAVFTGYDLSNARAFYDSLGFSTPEKTPVYIYTRVGKSPDQEKAINSGLWDGEVLGINSKSVRSDGPNPEDCRAASAHEYWHAVTTHNSFGQAWPGMEEAVAVALESLVWPSAPGTPHDQMMGDFLKLHAWHACSPVLRSGLHTVGPDEEKESRGYKQWPFIKHLFHKEGKEALVDLVRGKMTPERLDKALYSFALSAFVSDQVLADPAPLAGHPMIENALTNTGFRGHVLVQDAVAKTVLMGSNDLKPVHQASINAFSTTIAARPASVPPCPLVVRRSSLRKEHFLWVERFVVGKPVATGIAQPKLSEIMEADYGLAVPEGWDGGAGSLPIMIVGSAVARPLAATNREEQNVREGASNPLLVYRLAPPTGVKFQHLASASDADSKTQFTWTLPELGGSLKPADALGAYRIYGRKAGGPSTFIAEVVLKRENAPSGWHQGGAGSAKIEPGDAVVELPIARSKVLPFDEFAMSSVDALMLKDGKPLESPAGWEGATDIWAALAKCNSISFQATVGFVGETTTLRKEEAPVVVTTTYPVQGNSVNPPDVWGFGSAQFSSGKFRSQQGSFEFAFAGELGGKGAVSAGSLMDVLNAFTPEWPFNAGSAFDGPTSVVLRGSVDREGRLVTAALTIQHPQFGCAITFGDLKPAVLKIDGDAITFTYLAKEEEATAKSSGHSTWMKWIFTGGSSEFRMKEYRQTRSLRLTISRVKA